MGMSHWNDSDGAADFVYIYKKATTPAQRRKVIDTELKDFANSYNTPGSVNIALAMEDGIVRKTDLNANQLNKLRALLADLKTKSSAKLKNEWDNESGRLEHHEAYKRLLKHMNKNLS